MNPIAILLSVLAAPIAAAASQLSPLHAVILGLVEGVTEYLPVSSTGHLILTSHLLGLHDNESQKAAIDAFEVVIQGGAILAVLGLYFPRFLQMAKGLLGQDPAGLKLLINIVIAFVPAAVVGLAAKKTIDTYLFSAVPVIAAMIIGGVYMIIVDWYIIRPRAAVVPVGAAQPGKAVTDLTPRGALTIGLLQVVSLWPGTSRSMMTITGGVFAGLAPAAAAEFSFLLGMPTLLAATGYSLFKNLRESAKEGTPNMFQQLGVTPSLIGIAVAAVAAAVAVRWLVGFLNKHGLAPFGYYRLAMGALLVALMLAGMLHISK